MDWLEIDSKVKSFEDSIIVPDSTLSSVNCIYLKNEQDLLKIPKEGGCYWIWTN